MAEKVIEKVVVDESAEPVEPKDVQPTVNEDAIQAKIDSAVKSRLAREKEHQKQLEASWAEEKAALEEELNFLKAEFQKQLDERLADVPVSFRSVLVKLSIRDQLEWLKQHEEEENAKPKPQIMPQFGKPNQEGKPEPKHDKLDRIF